MLTYILVAFVISLTFSIIKGDLSFEGFFSRFGFCAFLVTLFYLVGVYSAVLAYRLF
jgi:hypothetical protein